MIAVKVFIITIPKFHIVKLFLLTRWNQIGILFDMKIRVNPNNKTIGKTIKIITLNNRFPFYFDQLSTITLSNRIIISN